MAEVEEMIGAEVEWEDPDEFDDDFGKNPIRSRTKNDLWHQFKLLPMAKSCPKRSIVFELMFHSTFVLVEDDYERVADFLAGKGVDKDELFDHFYFHREWWRKRVRMVPHDSDQHAYWIRAVHMYVKENMAEHYDKELEDYFNTFEQRCRDGWFEEVGDVCMFRHVGCDSNGLDLWIRLRGTVRNENVHSRMRVSLPPWGIGPRTAHWLLVSISYRYNVNAGIKRHGKHDFGHPWHSLIDRIQIRIQEIYDAIVFPTHENVLQFNPIDGWVAVGIGPLSYSPDYVDCGPPSPKLKGDTKFIAEKMGLVLPPLPISHPIEKAMYNRFRESHPNMTTNECKELAKIFKTKADGVHVFPKLDSMVHQYDKKWKRAAIVKLARAEVKESYKKLRGTLTSQTIAAPPLDEKEDDVIMDMAEDEMKANNAIPQANMHVAPLCAADQNEFVPTMTKRATPQQDRDCVWAPVCPKKAHVCGGWNKDGCMEVKEGRVTIPEDFAERKKAHQKEANKRRMAQAREAKKKLKESKK